MTDLGKLTGGNGHCRAWGVSADGNVVIGESGTTFAGTGHTEAFRWTQIGGMVDVLGDSPKTPKQPIHAGERRSNTLKHLAWAAIVV
jgi:probable HAF family extracellular repeat protein